MNGSGSVPDSWVECTLGDVVDYGSTEKAEPSEISGDAWVLELEDVESHTSRVLQRLNFAERQSKSTKNRFRAGDVLYGKLRPYLNKVVRADRPGFCTTEIVPISPPDGVEAAFLFHWLRHPRFLSYVSGVSHGLNMPRLGTEAGQQAPFVLAPSNEQKRIVAKVEELTARSRRAKEALDAVPPLLDQLRQSILAAAFRGDLTADWRTSHSSGGCAAEIVASLPRDVREEWKLDAIESVAGLPSSWLRVPFGALVRSMRSGTTAVPQDDRTAIPVLRSSSVRPGQVDLEDARFLDPKDKHNEQNFLNDDDLLFTRLSGSRDYVANCAWVHGLQGRRIQYPDRLFRAQLVDASMAPYLEACFGWSRVHEEIVGRTKSTAGHQRVSIGAITEQLVPLAPLHEQHEIVRRLQAIMGAIESLREQVAQAEGRLGVLEAAALAKAFRGQLVAQDPSDEPASVLLERIRAARESAVAGAGSRRRSRKAEEVAEEPDEGDDDDGGDAPSPPVPSKPTRRGMSDLSELDADAVHDEVFAALWTRGPLEKHDAVRQVAEHLRAAGDVEFQRLRADGPLFAQLLGFIEAAVKAGRLDRPKRGHVRACKADATTFTADDWRFALVASLGETPTDREEAIRVAAEWARDNLGLEFARLRSDGHIVLGLRSAINSAIRRGEVTRHDAIRISRGHGR